jgi:AAT family amino acid transporter/GABA permease
MVALAEIPVRRRLESSEPERLSVRMWLYPFGSWFAIACIAAILAAMAVMPVLRPQLLCSLVVLAVALFAFFALRRRAA